MDFLIGLALTAHLGFGNNVNDFHPTLQLQNNSFIAGAFYNSESNASLYAGFIRDIGKIDIEFGLATGYSTSSVVPFVRGVYNVNDNINVFVVPAPRKDGNLGIVLGTQIHWRN
jgi:hypothetical protein